MIVVKIELHSARSGEVTEIGRMHISNDGKTTIDNPNLGTYRAELFRKGTDKVHKETIVRNWPRKSKTVWELLHKVLDNLYG